MTDPSNDPPCIGTIPKYKYQHRQYHVNHVLIDLTIPYSNY